ncbi:MAG: DUF4097 domain-containing protein [Lachnospiraceae bacterium]|nr:DUF4097 domain-containing protein [Lachnospiraceae bacterium]
MKETYIKRICVLIVAFALCTVILVLGIALANYDEGPVYEYDEDTYEVYDQSMYSILDSDSTVNISSDGLMDSLNIHWYCGNIYVCCVTDSDDIIVTLSGSSGGHAFYRSSGKALDIRYTNSNAFIPQNCSKDLVVQIPEKLANKMSEISVTVETGEIKLSDIYANKVSLDGYTGDIMLNSCSVKKLDINTWQSDLDFFGTNIGTLKCTANCGDFHYEGIVDMLDFVTGSGSAYLCLGNSPKKINISASQCDADIYFTSEISGFTAVFPETNCELITEFDNEKLTLTNGKAVYGDGKGIYINYEVMDSRLFIGKSADISTDDIPVMSRASDIPTNKTEDLSSDNEPNLSEKINSDTDELNSKDEENSSVDGLNSKDEKSSSIDEKKTVSNELNSKLDRS